MRTNYLIEKDLPEAEALAGLVRQLNSAGHNPATSGNYSFRSRVHPGAIVVSESGIDKSVFTTDHFLLVDEKTANLFGPYSSSGRKSSDETGIHLAIYRSTSAGCVLHSHLLESLLFADFFPDEPMIIVEGLELLKGFRGVKTHETRFEIPCFANSQNIEELARTIEAVLPHVATYGLLLRGHGIYVWGDTAHEARRHLEVFEYIFKYTLARNARRLA